MNWNIKEYYMVYTTCGVKVLLEPGISCVWMQVRTYMNAEGYQ